MRAIARSLARRAPREQPADSGGDPHEGLRRASVALVVRPQPSRLEVLLIQRATVAGDPWSGHMALPGGMRATADSTPAETAVRETQEEVGIDLARDGALLGRLDEVAPRSGGPRVAVSPFVFGVPATVEVRPNHEVAAALWVPVGQLAAPEAAIEHLHALASGETLRFPAIGYRDYVIWGLTHRILHQFFQVTRAEGEVDTT